ncbi:two-component sensor histidine kinase BarA [Serratia microhaemolytica]|uniref:two-component sensor histidine kinase BarA n=1 Tax=Serratia microhaemolytica TaxID=2675110 RepID=UPI000FDF47E0|nr:two-component sensor histidine kinase BarA [Serratia microhaemolytica]
MTKYSLRARMMLLILIPTLLIGLLLSTFFIVHRYNELKEQFIEAGVSIIEPLAAASEYGMTFSNRESVKQLVNLLHRRHSDILRAITVFDVNNNLFVTSNYHYNYQQLQLPKGLPMPTELMLTWRGESLILRTPILSESRPLNESSTASGREQFSQNIGYVAIELDLKSMRLQQYQEVFVAALLLLFCMIIAVLFAYRLIRDVVLPLGNMVDTVDRIRRGQLDSRVEGQMLGELHMLKNGINSMAMSLTAYHEELQQNIDQATSDLRETLEQMEIQNVELDLAKKRAQEAARIKSEFLANMSHELRTPLNGVIGFTRQMLKTELNATQADYLQTIERSANNLLAIINDVLDFSKLEAGKLLLEHIPFSLRETVDEVVVLLAPSAHEKGLELTLAVQNDVPEQVIGDPLRLQQVITNLLGNAVKFTESGNIDIRIELASQLEHQVELEIQIHDTGIGISERQQSQLFQAFRQADASISRRHGGTGLGLVITQKLIKEMGGDISFHSQLNRGSTFWFQITLDLNEGLQAPPQLPAELRGKTLGYIESNPTAAQATLDMLSNSHLQVTHAATFEQLPANGYDFLLVGVPTCYQANLTQQQMLAKYLTSAEQVLLALPSQSSIDAEKMKKLGVVGCLAKPISSHRLYPLLALDSRQRQAEQKVAARLPLTVMAVDDNPANLKLIAALLEEQVEQTLLCKSGEEAIALARDHQVDMILMDIQMPNIDGIQASELIHQIPHHRSTPIVAVTAHAMIGEREQLLSLGMADYLAKPIDEVMLARLLARFHASEVEPLKAVHASEPSLSLDWALALRQAANKEDLARELLQMLLDFLPEVNQRVSALLEGGTDQGMLALIHKLHGSCSYSGVPRLRQLCFYLEQQLRQGVNAHELEPEWLELLDEIELLNTEAKFRLSEVR